MLPELIGLMALISRPSATVGIQPARNNENSQQRRTGISSPSQQLLQGKTATDGRPYPPPPPPPKSPVDGR